MITIKSDGTRRSCYLIWKICLKDKLDKWASQVGKYVFSQMTRHGYGWQFLIIRSQKKLDSLNKLEDRYAYIK